MRPVLVIQNDRVEGAGRFSTQLTERGYEQRTAIGDATDYDASSHRDYSALVVLGGPQGAYETDQYPYLLDEIALCQSFLEADKPIIGFCLGAQLLARALGGDVLPAEHREVGWYDLRLTSDGEEDPMLEGHPETLVSFHFHGDRIVDVPGGVVLASSALTPIQLFRYGSKAYGIQYHAEVDRPLLELMCENNKDYLARSGVDLQTVLNESALYLADFEEHCRAMLDRWIDLIDQPKPL